MPQHQQQPTFFFHVWPSTPGVMMMPFWRRQRSWTDMVEQHQALSFAMHRPLSFGNRQQQGPININRSTAAAVISGCNRHYEVNPWNQKSIDFADTTGALLETRRIHITQWLDNDILPKLTLTPSLLWYWLWPHSSWSCLDHDVPGIGLLLAAVFDGLLLCDCHVRQQHMQNVIHSSVSGLTFRTQLTTLF